MIYTRKSSDEGSRRGVQFAAGAARDLRAKDTKVGCACLKVITIAGFSGATMDQVGTPPAAGRYRAGAARSLRSLHRHWILPPCRLWRRRVLRRDHGSARSATAARRHHGGSRIRDKIRGIVADVIIERCGTGIGPDRDITAFRPDIPAPACLCRPRPLVPARTTAASRRRKANSRERQVRT